MNGQQDAFLNDIVTRQSLLGLQKNLEVILDNQQNHVIFDPLGINSTQLQYLIKIRGMP